MPDSDETLERDASQDREELKQEYKLAAFQNEKPAPRLKKERGDSRQRRNFGHRGRGF